MKPKICGRLHEAWIKVKAMKSIIIKEWDKIGINRYFLPTFQPITMEANTPMPLFK